jgi:hypothetical protein
MRHKHYEVIIAYANGKEIQCYSEQTKQWVDAYRPSFLDHVQYRVKPEPKQDTISFLNHGDSHLWTEGEMYSCYANAVIKITRDGETGKIKSAEVIK